MTPQPHQTEVRVTYTVLIDHPGRTAPDDIEDVAESLVVAGQWNDVVHEVGETTEG